MEKRLIEMLSGNCYQICKPFDNGDGQQQWISEGRALTEKALRNFLMENGNGFDYVARANVKEKLGCEQVGEYRIC